MPTEIDLALEHAPVLSRRKHRHLAGSINHAIRTGRLVPLFPGTYARETSFDLLTEALFEWDPDAVLVGGAAAKLTWWPELPHDVVHAAVTRQLRRDVPGVSLERRRIPPELVITRAHLRVQHPSASTLDLARITGPSAIDEALRRRVVTISSLRWAHSLMPGRRLNTVVARYLRDSADEPWSALERQAHHLLHKAGISGWRANYRVRVSGNTYFLDAAFPGRRLALEFDGWQFHGDRASFIRDRERDVALRMAGWTVLHFTAETLSQVVTAVRHILDE